MPDSTSPTPMPAPDAGANSNPDLNVVPPAAAGGASPFPLNRAVEEECNKAEDLANMARRDEYKGRLEPRTIVEGFCTTLKNDVIIVRRRNRLGVQADAAGKDATRTGTGAEEMLVASLRELQAAARLQHLPEHPDLLDPYLVGQRIADNREVLKSASQAIIDQANEDRFPGIDTSVIDRVKGERTQVVGSQGTQGDEAGKGTQERQLRDELVKSVIARRKKIQYAADQAFPYVNPFNAKARADFKLPANRPYSY